MTGAVTETLWLEHAWLGRADAGTASAPSSVADGVLVRVENGRFADVRTGVAPPAEARTVQGLSLPGLANCHSHAFHRGLRGRTQRDRGSFWTWRKQMYALAGRLDPDRCFTLARAVYREMVLAGFTAVGEFHYLHHDTGGRGYADPNAMGGALVAAAGEAGIRIALLDALYLTSAPGQPLEGVQRRFGDGDADRWASRADGLVRLQSDAVRVGAALHSVRAVPPEQMATVAAWAGAREAPLHVHLSEQPAENEACLEAYGATPTSLLAREGVLGRRTSVVHATHLTEQDGALLGAAGVTACFCPTTERDLGDGVGPSRALVEAGCRLTLGSDSHAVVDPFEEMRAVELDERLATRERGHWAADDLLVAATVAGHASLGFDAGRIAVGSLADLVTVDVRSPRTAGTGGGPETAVFAATAADVREVRVGGRLVATAADAEVVGAELARAVDGAWEAR